MPTTIATTPPTPAIVPVKKWWESKTNWAQFISLAAALLSVWGFELPSDVQVKVMEVIIGVQALVTWVLNTFFRAAVIEQSVASAPVVMQSRSVDSVTPPGGVVSTVGKP